MHRIWLLGFCSLVVLSCAQTFETITNSDYASCEIKSANRLTGNLQTRSLYRILVPISEYHPPRFSTVKPSLLYLQIPALLERKQLSIGDSFL